MRNRTAFFLDRIGVRFFDGQKGSGLGLELRIEEALLISLATLFREINRGSRHRHDDTHHRQAQLCQPAPKIMALGTLAGHRRHREE